MTIYSWWISELWTFSWGISKCQQIMLYFIPDQLWYHIDKRKNFCPYLCLGSFLTSKLLHKFQSKSKNNAESNLKCFSIMCHSHHVRAGFRIMDDTHHTFICLLLMKFLLWVNVQHPCQKIRYCICLFSSLLIADNSISQVNPRKNNSSQYTGHPCTATKKHSRA